MKMLRPLANEHFFSVVSRSFSLSGYPKEEYLLKEIDASKFVPKATIGVCPRILTYCSNTKDLSMLYRYSSYPLWLLANPSTDILETRILRGESKNLRESVLIFNKNWQYCPSCLSSDKNQFGNSYWHVEHNLPGITHCAKHHVPLVKSHRIMSFSELRMPHRLKADFIDGVHQAEDVLLKWSLFINDVYTLIVNDFSKAASLRQEVLDYLNIPILRPIDRREFYSDLLINFEKSMPKEILEHCFLFYQSHNYKKKPNVLLTTIFKDGQSIRNPVYWLVILFWLREELPTLSNL